MTRTAIGAAVTARSRASASPITALLEVDALTLRFGGIPALAGVSFAVQPGSITAVIGPIGAGKTRLLSLRERSVSAMNPGD